MTSKKHVHLGRVLKIYLSSLIIKINSNEYTNSNDQYPSDPMIEYDLHIGPKISLIRHNLKMLKIVMYFTTLVIVR